MNGHHLARPWRHGATAPCPLLPARRAGWPRRFAGLTATLLLLTLTVSGCSLVGAAIRTSSALHSAGFQNVSLNITTGSGMPPDGVVHVSYTARRVAADAPVATPAGRRAPTR